MWAAIRYRRAQAVALLLLSALITTCAVLAPLYSRALEQSLLRVAIDRVDPSDTLLTLTVNRATQVYDLEPDEDLLMPSALEQRVPGSLAAVYEEPLSSLSAQVLYEIFPGRGATELTLRARDGSCEHLTIVDGECPTRAGQVAISSADRAKWRFALGQQMPVAEKGSSDYSASLTVVGVYEQDPDDPSWLGTVLTGKSGTFVGNSDIPALDDWITPEASFRRQWFGAAVTAQYVLRPERVTLDDVPRLRADVAGLEADPLQAMEVSSSIGEIGDRIERGREQVRLIVPLLMAQLGLLAVVVLASVLGSAVEQRRPEVALARLRGRGPSGAARLVIGELGTVVLAGIPLGFAAGLGVSTLGRVLLLPEGVGFELPVATLAALALAVVVTLTTVVLVALPVTRQPIGALLRRVAARRRSAALPTLDVLTIALAAAGVIGLVTGSLTGPLALLTPTLIALAVGVLGARVWTSLAGSGTPRRLDRSRLAGALGSWQIGRRVALRKILTIITVATALAVFAVNAYLVADRNRTYRAELEAGAPTVLAVAGVDPVALRRAVTEVDPQGRVATPVAVYRQRDATALSTLGVVPAQFPGVAYAGHDDAGRDWSELAAPDTPTLLLTGSRITATVSSTLVVGGQPAGPGAAGAPSIGLTLTYANGQQATRSFGTVPLADEAASTVTTSLLCPEPCRVDGVVVQSPGGGLGGTGTITLADVRVDGGEPLELGDPADWQAAIPPSSGYDELAPSSTSSGTTLVMDSVNSGVRMRMAYGDVPSQLPVLLAGSTPSGSSPRAFLSPDMHGRPVAMAAAQQVPSLPLVGAAGVVANYDTMARLGGDIAVGGRLEVWLSTAEPARVGEVVDALDEAGFPATVSRTYADTKATYDASASGWGLQLALLVALASVLMAGLVVVVVAVTSWRAVTRDFAALAMAGVPHRTLRAALRGEQLRIVGVGVLLGGASGLAGAWLSTPLIPMFDTAAAAPTRSLVPAWGWVAATVLVALVLLGTVGLLVARSIGRRISYARLREMA